MWSAISNFGDAALTLPLAATCCLWLAIGGSGWRAAWTWLGLLAAAALLVGATKILYAGCGVEWRAIDFRVISGHTMLAAGVWPMACMLGTDGSGRPLASRLALACGFVLATAITTARAFDRAHSVSEVIVGLAVGALVTVCFLRWRGVPSVVPGRRPYALASLLLVSVAMYGQHAPIQRAIQKYSPYLCRGAASTSASLVLCPIFTGALLHPWRWPPWPLAGARHARAIQ
ncbi:phosphatase PAP2 family protein [Xanthomonas theicola]|nr:phosphatase PAP2 family protein [Xanthomonas theicola]